MVVSDASIHNIMGGMESTAGVRLHNHRRKLKQRFDIIKKLGQGTYGKVQLGINKETGQEVAIKTIKKAKIETEADLVRIRREIQIMSSVQHPNIIHIYEVFENREKMVLVMEYAAGGELYDFLSEKKVLAEDEARRIFRQIATAVYYCHKHKICHRDLKLENILLDEHGSAKIADFGLSNVFNEQRLLNTFCGSPLYASPEIVKGTPYHGPEVDCWSLGVLLYTLVYGAMPFDGSNFKRLVKQISQGDYFEPKKPSPASPLIKEMLTVTPARRANIEKICAHWWVNEGHTDSCLDIAEELANQTPVRLDLLLSLAPPPPAVGSDMLLTDEQGGGDSQRVSSDALGPARCHSVGSIMELDQPAADRRIKEFERQKQRGSIGDGTPVIKDAPKRKLEEGVSSEDVVHGVVKKKESCRRQDNEPITSKASPSKSNNKSSPCMATEEKMDVDVDISESVLPDAIAEINGAVENNSEGVKNDAEVTESASAIIDAGISEAIAQKPDEKESNKTTTGRDKTTRKSVKGSPKKSKQVSSTSADNNAVQNKVLSNKDTESKSEAKEDEDMMKIIENNAEGSDGLPVEVSSEVNKEKESPDATVTEAVKQKVKKKKKITSSKAEELPNEGPQKIIDQGPCESSLELSDLKPKEGESSSQDSKNEFTNEEVAESETKDVSEITNNVTPVAKDVMSVKTTETSKTGSVKAKKPPGDLTISKMGSSSEKSSGSEEVTSPTKNVERRRSKIFENSEQFNIFLRGSEPKLTTGDKPKKVFIPGVKVSDYKQAFERRSSLSTSASSLPIKSSTSKKSAEQNSTNAAPSDVNSSDEGKSLAAAELKSADKLKISGKSKEQLSSLSADATLSKQISKDENSIETNAVISKPEVNNDVVGDKIEGVELPRTLKDDDADLKLVPALQVTDKMSQQEKARIKKLKDAVDIISNAIAEETKREAGDSPPVRKISSTKPPVPGLIDKSKTKSAVNTSSSTKSPPTTPNEKKAVLTQLSTDVKSDVPENVEKLAPEGSNVGEPVQKETDTSAVKQVESDSDINVPAKKKSSKVEITLKSATLPRRRTSKAEIQLGFSSSKPADSPAAGEYRTEVEHMVGNSVPSRLQTQRSEVAFPVAAAKNIQPMSIRSSSLEPEGTPKVKSKPREHIIPIQVEQEKEEGIRPPAAKPPVPPLLQQRSISQRASSLSRQSTQDSDTDSTISVSGPEPIRKSPREYIIPIAVEGGGYVTPRAGSLEPSVSEASTEPTHPRSSGRTNKLRKMGSLLSDSEDEGFNSPYVTLQRHSSVSREGDNADDDRPFHRMHKLRSSKPRRATLEHNDSLSSAEEEDDDDDDGFEILTAESLFSTLLSRVRSLTQRLNVEDGGRTGFPSSRLMSHLAASGHNSPSSGFWSNIYGFPGDPLSRRVSESSQYGRPFGEGPTPWRRSVSRDTSEVDSVYSEGDGGTLPRGSSRFDCGSLSDDAGIDTSTSFYTPNLNRRMQQNWHSSSQNLGNLSALNRENALSDNDWSMNYHGPSRKSSLGSLTSPSSSIPQHNSSRRLARTLSLHSRNEDRRNKDIQGSHAMDYSRSHPVRTDHYTPTRRSICSLDNRSFVGMPSYRSSSTSDSGIYNAGNRTSDLERVLPPLPYSAGSRERRKDSSKSSAYIKQHSLDINSSLHTGNDISYVPYSKGLDEALRGQPHHSSSLPAISKIKSKKLSDKVGKEAKPTVADNESKSSMNQTTKEISSHINEDNLKSVNRKIVEDGNKHIKKSPSRERSKIPSLLHFRSPSASRELEKGKSYGSSNKEQSSGVTVKKSHSISSSSTPDRSILSKFFRQGSEEKESSKGTEIPGDDKDASKKKRRISRFLRPDFFDTPREESAYAKKKDAKKAAEAESKLKNKNIVKKVDCNPSLPQTNMPELQVASTSLNGNGINTEESCVDNASSVIEAEKDIKVNKKNGKQMKPAADIKQNSNVKNNNKLATDSPAFEKQTTNCNNKSGFLVSLERKLEKFRSSGDDVPSASNSGKSRVDKAICSLREQSQLHNRSDIVTSESHLLKRAVSVGDCCTIESSPKENSNQKMGGKVTSVLGFLRKLEDTPGRSSLGPPPTTSALSRLRRTQSVYAGSQSDSILSDSKESMCISNEGKPISPVNVKMHDSNPSVICNKSNKGISSLQKNVQTDMNSGNSDIVDTKVENCSKSQSNYTVIGGTATSGKSTENSAELTKYESMSTGKESFSKSGTRENVKTKLKIKKGSCNELKKELGLNTKQLIKNNNEIDTNSSEAIVIAAKPSVNDDFKSFEVTAKPSSAQADTVSVSTKAVSNSALLDRQERGQRNISDYEAKETRELAINLKENANAIIQQASSQEENGLLNDDTGNESCEVNTKKDICVKTADMHNAGNENILSNLPNELNELPYDDYGLNDDEIKFANVKQLDSCSCPGDESSLISPAESESIDSWSVCSDFDTRDFPTSPVPPLGEEESVVDRIRRKSFYSRFNDVKKKHRKTSLSSLSTYPSSYREPNSLYHHQSHPKKKDYHADYILSPSHSSGYYHDKPSRSQSQNDYDTKPTILNRKSPLPVKSQLSYQGDINSRNLDSELNIYDVNDDMEKINSAERDFGEFNQKTASYGNEVGKNTHSLGGSMEMLRMPRYFNNSAYLGASSVPTSSYTCPIRRASDSHISESAKYNIGSIIPKSQLPVSSRIPNTNIGNPFTSHSGNDMRGGETFPARAKYNRFKSHHSPDIPPPLHVVPSAGEEEISRVESERPVTPR